MTRCDAAELTEALDTLLRDAPRCRAMGNAGRLLVQRKWTWETVVHDLLGEYQKVIERARVAHGPAQPSQ